MYNKQEKLWCCITSNTNETDKLIKSRISSIVSPYALFLDGELGSGKTYVCKQIARVKNINNINSSSFSKMNLYYSNVKIIHADFYNIYNAEDFLYDEIYPHINDKTILLAEWISCSYPLGILAFKLSISLLKNNQRRFSMFKIY